MTRLACSALLVALALPAAAQTPTSPVTGARPGNDIGTGQSLPAGNAASNVTPESTRSVIAPNLPAPDVGPGAGPRAYLEAAERAMTLGRTGEAQEALERAESRMLDRSVAPSRANAPDAGPAIRAVGDARRALAAGDRARARQIVGELLSRMRG